MNDLLSYYQFLDSSCLSQMSFCLTSGHEWLFGIMDTSWILQCRPKLAGKQRHFMLIKSASVNPIHQGNDEIDFDMGSSFPLSDAQ